MASKVSRGPAKPKPDSPSTLQSTRQSVDGSPRSSLNSKPTIDRKSPKVATPPEVSVLVSAVKYISFHLIHFLVQEVIL